MRWLWEQSCAGSSPVSPTKIMKEIVNQILSKSFLYEVPSVHTQWFLPLEIVFGVMILASIAIFIFAKGESRKIWRGYFPPLLTGGILGFIHLGARYESLPYLCTRFFLLLTSTLILIWLTVILMKTANSLPKMQEEKKIEEKFNKYLPVKKKGKVKK